MHGIDIVYTVRTTICLSHSARKVYDNGIVYILLPDGKRYNLQGAEVK